MKKILTFQDWVQAQPTLLTNGELAFASKAWEQSAQVATRDFLLFGNVFEGVVRPWVCALPKMQQTVLLCALRGPDGMPKVSDAKIVIKMFRHAVIHNARPLSESAFMLLGDDDAEVFALRTRAFIEDFDAYPWHFVMHLIHAAEIVGYKHPDETIKGRWFNFYALCVQALHMNIESRAELDRRLNV